MTDLLIGFTSSFIIALIAYYKHSLSKSGFITAVLVGTGLYFFGTWILWLTLMLFFISSSVLSSIKKKYKESISVQAAKTGKRDYIQVLANGFLPLLFSIIGYFTNESLFLMVSVASIATSNSDTWASELGVLSRGNTYSIITWRIVEKGSSGGISLYGTVISFFGAFFIGFGYSFLKVVFNGLSLYNAMLMMLLLTIAGFIGCIIDSILGGTLQAKYFNEQQKKIVEIRPKYNSKDSLVKGIRFFTNDVVNFTSAGLASVIVMLFIFR